MFVGYLRVHFPVQQAGALIQGIDVGKIDIKAQFSLVVIPDIRLESLLAQRLGGGVVAGVQPVGIDARHGRQEVDQAPVELFLRAGAKIEILGAFAFQRDA